MAPGDCCIPPPAADYEGKGSEETWGHLQVYAVGSPTSSSAVLFICDIYGWRVPQSRYLADKLAARGHFVILPDFLHNDFFWSPDVNNPYEGLPDFLAKHSQPMAIEEAGQLIEILRVEKGMKKVGVMGNCWGGKITVALLKGDKGVDAAVMNHPSFLLDHEIEDVKVPLAILGAEIDTITPPDMALHFGTILKKSPLVGDKSYVKIFEGVDHGWTTRYDLEDQISQQKANEAHVDAIEWFTRFLHP